MMAASGAEIVHGNLTNVFVETSRIYQDMQKILITQALTQESLNQDCYVNFFSRSGVFSPYFDYHAADVTLVPF